MFATFYYFLFKVYVCVCVRDKGRQGELKQFFEKSDSFLYLTKEK